jgi:hypothetical protein
MPLDRGRQLHGETMRVRSDFLSPPATAGAATAKICLAEEADAVHA